MEGKQQIEDKLRKHIYLINKVKNIDLEIEKLSYNNRVPDKNRAIESLNKAKRDKEIDIEKINNALAVLDTRQRKIIELRYILPEKLDWNKISEIMQLSDRTCRIISCKAIEEMIPIIFQ